MSMAGTIGSAVLSAKATIKAQEILSEEEWNHRGESLSTKDKTRLVWKCYIPPAIAVIGNCLCIGYGNHLHTAKEIQLLGAVTASKTLCDMYLKKAQELYGEKAAQEIRHAVTQEQVEERYNGPITSERLTEASLGIYQTGDGNELFMDAYTKMLLWSSKKKLLEACGEYNRLCSTGVGTFFPLNDFYSYANLPDVGAGKEVGYSSQYRMENLYFRWDSDRRLYQEIYFQNPPRSEPELNVYR